MDLSFTTMNTPEDIRPDVLARTLESLGYESLFIGEHSHIPAARTTPYPASADGRMPDQYMRMMDPFVSLAIAAGATTTLRLGLGVCLVLEHHILDLAKSAATLDVLSEGRLLFGVGVGWNQEELANHRPDIAWGQRYRATEECVMALRSCWTDDNAEFHGSFFDFAPVWSFPKPRQRALPVLMGAGGRIGTEHAARWADEWMPVDLSLGNIDRRVQRFRERTSELGRDVPISLVLFGDPTYDTLQRYADLGVRRTIIGSGRSHWDDPATARPFIERWAQMIPSLAR